MSLSFFFFFFNDTATTEIYTLSLHDALPISATYRLPSTCRAKLFRMACQPSRCCSTECVDSASKRSEEHTSELQSRLHLVCRLLLEKKNTKKLTFNPLAPHPTFVDHDEHHTA